MKTLTGVGCFFFYKTDQGNSFPFLARYLAFMSSIYFFLIRLYCLFGL